MSLIKLNKKFYFVCYVAYISNAVIEPLQYVMVFKVKNIKNVIISKMNQKNFL